MMRYVRQQEQVAAELSWAEQRPFLFALLMWFKCLRERVPPTPLALRLFTFNDSQTNHRERTRERARRAWPAARTTLRMRHVCKCVCVRLLKCFQISRISGQQRQQNDAGSLLTFRRLFVRQIVHRFSSSSFFLLFLPFFWLFISDIVRRAT